MNTAQFIPFECVSAIMLEDPNHPDYPFFSGTGFFVKFPPYQDIFFVTARHCIKNNHNSDFLNILQIPIDSDKFRNQSVPFSSCLETRYVTDENEGDREDVIVFVVSDTISSEIRNILLDRALSLQHQDDVDSIIINTILQKGKIRTVGFPDISKNIDYDANQSVVQPRGFHADLIEKGELENRYKIDNLNWKEGSLNGFSGSPILALCKNHKIKYDNLEVDVVAIPIGIFVTSKYFISINVVTDLIGEYLARYKEK